MKYIKLFEYFTDYYDYNDIDATCYDVYDENGVDTGYVIWMINPEEIIECDKRKWIQHEGDDEYYILEKDMEEVEDFLEDFRYAKKHGIEDIEVAKQSRKYNL